MVDEVYDVIDEKGAKIRTATWTEVHTKGLLHQCASALIFKDATRQETLLTQRSLTMAQHPGLWQHAAGGHVLTGDTVDEGIRKELQEELFAGHELPPFEIKRIASFYNNDIPNNREILTLYEVIYPGPFYADPKEVADRPRFVDWNELLKDMKTNPKKYSTAFHNIIKAYLKSTSSISQNLSESPN